MILEHVTKGFVLVEAELHMHKYYFFAFYGENTKNLFKKHEKIKKKLNFNYYHHYHLVLHLLLHLQLDLLLDFLLLYVLISEPTNTKQKNKT